MMSPNPCKGSASGRRKFLMCGGLIHTYKARKTDTVKFKIICFLHGLACWRCTPTTGIRSQSLDRMVCTVNQSSCITPSARLWLRYRERLMLPAEKFLLHGMILKEEVELGSSTTSNLNKLAGNSWSYHNFVIGFVSSLCTLPVQWLQE